MVQQKLAQTQFKKPFSENFRLDDFKNKTEFKLKRLTNSIKTFLMLEITVSQSRFEFCHFPILFS